MMRCRRVEPRWHPFKGDGGHCDDGAFGGPLFQIVISRLAFGQPNPPAVIVHHDRHMIRIIEGGGRAIEGCVIEVPLR